MSHHSCVFCPKTTPIFPATVIRFLYGSIPSISTFPDVGFKIPHIILIVVLFPAPLEPIYPTISPSLILKLISLTASLLVYFRENNVLDIPFTPCSLTGFLNSFVKFLTSIIFLLPFSASFTCVIDLGFPLNFVYLTYIVPGKFNCASANFNHNTKKNNQTKSLVVIVFELNIISLNRQIMFNTSSYRSPMFHVFSCT